MLSARTEPAKTNSTQPIDSELVVALAQPDRVDGDPVTLCANCGERPGHVKWLGELGMLALTHGMHVWWCEVCVNQAHIAYAEKQAARLPGLYRDRDHILTAPLPPQ